MTDFEKGLLRAVERIALALERRTACAPAVSHEPARTPAVSHEPARTPAVSHEPAPPLVPPGQPEDKTLEFSQGPFKGKKLSELDEKQLRQLIKGFQSSLQKASDDRDLDRHANYSKWVALIQQWAEFRGIKLVPAQP